MCIVHITENNNIFTCFKYIVCSLPQIHCICIRYSSLLVTSRYYFYRKYILYKIGAIMNISLELRIYSSLKKTFNILPSLYNTTENL